ncbi:MAG: YIP1 family protein [Anaerolineae bacterium]|nr:YIP1 family protein [Anaerolineae bacterium]
MANTSPANDRRPPLVLLILGIFLRPGVTLRAVARAPARLWLVPFLLAIALLSARVAVSAPLQEERRLAVALAAWQAQLEGFPKEMQENPPQWFLDQRPRPRPSDQIYGPPLVSGIGLLLLGFIARAGVLHLLCLAMGGQNRFGQVLSVSAWAAMPFVLRDGVQAASMSLSKQLILQPGLSGLIAEQGLTKMLAEQVDLYLFWHLLLLILGVAAMARFSRGKSLAVAFSYWLLAIAVSTTPDLVSFFLSGGATRSVPGPGPVIGVG